MNRTSQLDDRIEEALREIGKERLLSDAQRSRIRAAMIAASQEQVHRRAQRSGGLGSLLWSRLLPAGLALAAVTLIALAAYIAAGGSTGKPIAQAESHAAFTLFRRHSAPLDIAWYVDHIVQPNTPVIVAEGDILYAAQAISLTFTSQAFSLIRPGTEVALLPGRQGLQLRRGEVFVAVQPAAQVTGNFTGQNIFSVDTRRASVVVKGTQFSVYSSDDGDRVVTMQGAVKTTQHRPASVRLSAEVKAGEEVSLLDGATAPPVVQLHPPLAHAIEPGGRAIPEGAGTRQPEVSLVGSAYPGGTLTVDRPGLMLTTTVDAQGRFTVPVMLPALEGVYPFTLTIQSPDGRSRAGQLNVIVDKTAPNLSIHIPQLSAEGRRVRLQGQTESGATVTANGVELPVGLDGQFAAEVAVPADRTIQIVARDFAGNESTLTQIIRP